MLEPKVLIIIDSTTVGGPTKGIFQLIRHTCGGNVDFVLANFRYKDGRGQQFMRYAEDAGIAPKLFSQCCRFDPTPIYQAAKLLRKKNCNIVQTHGYKGHCIAAVLSMCYGIPWIALAHGWTDEDFKVRVYNTMERWLLRSADAAVGVSRPLYDELTGIRKQRPTYLIPNAVDPAEIKLEESADEVRSACNAGDDQMLFGVFGRLSREKGHQTLIDAVRALPRDDFKVVIVGQGGEEQLLKKLVNRYGLGDRILFVGHKYALKGYYQAIDLLMIPSLSEGLPNVLLEALAFGKPVVATAVGSIPEIIEEGKNGWLCQPGDAIALAGAIKGAIAERSRWRVMGQVAQATTLERFSPVKRSIEFLDLYRTVLTTKE